MADDTKSKLDEFRARVTGTARRALENPLIQAGPGAAFGPLGTLAVKGAQAALGPKTRDTTSFERTSPTTQDLEVARPAQVPAPFPYNQGPGMDGNVALKAPELAKSGGGVGGGVNPLTGLKGVLTDARTETMSGLDQDVEQVRDLGEAKVARIDKVAALQEDAAMNQVNEARLQQQADFDAHQNQVKFLQRNEQLADDIGKQQVDPDRLMKNKTAAQNASLVMGSILGGALRGLDGGPNSTLDRLDREIDRDIAAQESAIKNKKDSLSARQGLFAQMLQETGDSRVAAGQTRNLMLEGFKQKLLADGERAGIPEAKINAEQGARAIQAKQDAIREQTAAANYQAEQQRQAAAAAAAAAAQREAWQRSMQVAEMGLKRDELDIKRMEKQGETAKDINAEVASAAKDLSDEKLAKGRESVEALKGQLTDDGIAGVGMGAEAKRIGARALTLGLGSDSLVDRIAFNDQERVNRGNWEKLKLAYQSQITGSGASDSERKMISAAFEGAKTPAEQKAAVATAESVYKQIEQRRISGMSDGAKAEFARRVKRDK